MYDILKTVMQFVTSTRVGEKSIISRYTHTLQKVHLNCTGLKKIDDSFNKQF